LGGHPGPAARDGGVRQPGRGPRPGGRPARHRLPRTSGRLGLEVPAHGRGIRDGRRRLSTMRQTEMVRTTRSKRALDISLAALALVVTAPLLLLIALLI